MSTPCTGGESLRGWLPDAECGGIGIIIAA